MNWKINAVRILSLTIYIYIEWTAFLHLVISVDHMSEIPRKTKSFFVTSYVIMANVLQRMDMNPRLKSWARM